MKTTYHQAHRNVEAARGRAAEHPCVECGEPARDWAYQHVGEPELVSETGAPYSTDVSQYAPMCRGCHLSLDYDHGTVRGFATFWPTATEEYLEHHKKVATENAVAARAALSEKLRDPAEGPRIRAAQSEGAKQGGMAQVRRCSCGREMLAAPLGRHQKIAGHKGWEPVR